jgi:hypothetical protein
VSAVDELRRLVQELLTRQVLLALGIFSVIAFLATALVTPFILTRLPADYLVNEAPKRRRHPVLVLLKNALGVLVILLGVLLLVLPGQGVLTILLGLGLVDFPGRRRLERRALSRPSVLKTVNALRRRASRPPLELPSQE